MAFFVYCMFTIFHLADVLLILGYIVCIGIRQMTQTIVCKISTQYLSARIIRALKQI